jgi:hypothetical protein
VEHRESDNLGSLFVKALPAPLPDFIETGTAKLIARGGLRSGGTAELRITFKNVGNARGALGVVAAFANSDELPEIDFNCTTSSGAGWVSTAELTAQVAVNAKATAVITGLKLPSTPGTYFAVVLLDSTCKNPSISEVYEELFIPSFAVRYTLKV